MAKENTTVAIVLYKSKVLKNGESPLMIRITKNRKPKYISLGLSCLPKYWNLDKQEPRKSHPQRDVLNAILSSKKQSYLNQIYDFKNDGKDFTPDVLIQKVEREVKKVTVLDYFDVSIQNLENKKSIGYSNVFTDVKRSVKTFTKGKDLTFDQVTFSWLCKFENFLRAKDMADNSMSIRMRIVRTLYNNAIQEGYAKKENYPFNDYKISKRFNKATKKRAIAREDIKKIEKLEYKQFSTLFEAQQYFVFSYYAQGINFIDIAFLKWGDIENGRITYRRQKTGELITFKITDPLAKIIEVYRPFTGNSLKNHIFPVIDLNKHITATQQYNRAKKVLKRVNRDLKIIGTAIGLETPLTTYVARHSFASALKQANVSTAIISETMGHQSEAITKIYLKSFADSAIDQALENL